MKKHLSLLLALLMLLTMTQITACGNTNTENPSDTTANNTPTGTTPAETTAAPETEPYDSDDLGDIRFDGREFTMQINMGHNTYMVKEDAVAGDILDDNIIARNRIVEERLGITLNFINGQNGGGSGADQHAMAAALEKDILAQTNEIDAYVAPQANGMPSLITRGYFVDWNTLPNVNLDKNYWYQNVKRDINYGDKIFTMTGDYNINTVAYMGCMFFNKDMMEDLQLELPYQLVEDMKWTYDKFETYLQKASSDLNGDTVLDYDNDRYGFTGYVWNMIPNLAVGMGFDILTKGNDGEPVLTINTARNVDLTDRMLSLFSTDPVICDYSGPKAGWIKMFTDGRLLFFGGEFADADQFRDMDDDFGIIPYPMYDEAQQRYGSCVNHTAGLTSIPITNQDLEFTGACLEVLASTSARTVLPAYYDVVLSGREVRDEQSAKILPIIRDSASFYDFALDFSLGNMMKDTSMTLITYYAKQQNIIEQQVKDMTDIYCK